METNGWNGWNKIHLKYLGNEMLAIVASLTLRIFIYFDAVFINLPLHIYIQFSQFM